MYSQNAGTIFAQEELLGPSPIVPVDVAWLLDLKQATSYPATIDDERIYLPLMDGTLLALTLDTGAQVWSRHRPVHGKLMADNGILIATHEQLVIAFDGANGQHLWTHRFEQSHLTTVISNGWLVIQLRDSTLAALRATDGHEIWRRHIGNNASAEPAISGNRLYLPLETASGGLVSVLELSTGELAWEQPISGVPGPILPLDALFFGASDNFFYRLRLADGNIDWYVRTGGDIYDLPAVDEERVYFTSLDNIVRALDRQNGAQRWRMPLQGRPETGPIRVDNSLVLSGLSPNIQMFHTETGRPIGRFTAGNELAMPPHHVQREKHDDNRTVLLTRTGELTVLAPATGPEQLSPEVPLHPILPSPSRIPHTQILFTKSFLPPSDPPIFHARRFTVQVAVYDKFSAARDAVGQLREQGYPAFMTSSRRTRVGTLQRIRIGQSLGHGHAMRLIEQLEFDGITDARLIATAN
ncbi:hypothetical protein EVA25_02530 [bacterium]|nr:MAG: hypothetical protein EVA25_02530 [bacterium]